MDKIKAIILLGSNNENDIVIRNLSDFSINDSADGCRVVATGERFDEAYWRPIVNKSLIEDFKNYVNEKINEISVDDFILHNQ